MMDGVDGLGGAEREHSETSGAERANGRDEADRRTERIGLTD